MRPSKTTYSIVVVALMAAMVFVATLLLKFTIPTPAGPTMIKVANAICLLGGLLFGGMRGGLAAGIGSMLFDLSDPMFAPSAPYTLVFFFMMAFVCGVISHAGKQGGKNHRLNIVAACAGAVTYYVLNLGKSIILYMLAGSALVPALAAHTTKFIASGVNAVIAVVIAVALQPALRAALMRAGVFEKLK